jgi:hypothetical protein
MTEKTENRHAGNAPAAEGPARNRPAPPNRLIQPKCYAQYMKLNILLPIFIGLTMASIVYSDRIFDDIPGLPIIVLILCFLLIYYGVRNINKVNKNNKLVIVVPIFLGTAGIIWTSVLFLNGEFRDSPGFFIILNALYTACIFIGIFNIKRIRQKIDPGIIIPLFYCVCGIILAISLEFDGEISISQRILIIMILLFTGFLSIGIIMSARKLVKRNNNQIK